MPCAEHRAELERIIRELSMRFDTPPFVPHTTLCSGLWGSGEADLISAIDRLTGAVPAELTATGLEWTDHWASFFFLRLQAGEAMFEQASAQVHDSHVPEIGPHLSLMYRFQTEGIDRGALRKELHDCLPRTIHFDELALVRPSANGWKDICGWKSVCCFR